MATRRDFLTQLGLWGTGVAAGACQSAPLPALRSASARRVRQLLPGLATLEGAGVRLERTIGQPALRNLDPFLLLDRFYSDAPADYVRGFPEHPHRGFETVSILFEGNIRHGDSRGNHGLITGGGAQWMTAGRGIVHSEMPEQERGLLSGFQLWVNLPAREKLCPPFYQDLPPSRLAEARLSASGSRLRVLSGNVNGLVGPVRERPTEPLVLTLALADERPFVLELPAGHTAFAMVQQGSAHLGEEPRATAVPMGTLALLDAGSRLRVQARSGPALLLIAAARPLREPIAQRGPFVMNTEAELARAFADYRNGTLEQG